MISRILASLKSKLLFLVTVVLVVAFTFFISYMLNKAISFEDTEYFGTFFIWVRVIIAAMMIACALYVVLSKKDAASKMYLLLATALIQILPLVVRFIGLIDKEVLAIEISILALCLIGIPYFIFVFYLVVVSDQIKIATRRTKAEVTKAVDEDKYYDENGNFVGAKKKK